MQSNWRTLCLHNVDQSETNLCHGFYQLCAPVSTLRMSLTFKPAKHPPRCEKAACGLATLRIGSQIETYGFGAQAHECCRMSDRLAIGYSRPLPLLDVSVHNNNRWEQRLCQKARLTSASRSTSVGYRIAVTVYSHLAASRLHQEMG